MNRTEHTRTPLSAQLRLSVTALTATALCMLASCSGDGDDAPVTPAVQNLLQLDSVKGEPARFLLYMPAETTPRVLAPGSSLQLPENAFDGETFLVSYTPGGALADGSQEITVNAMARINNALLQLASPADLDGWDADPVWVTSIWRAGDKVNMRLMLPFDESPRQFSLAIDDTTLGDPYPTALLVHRRGSSSPTFFRQYYASFSCTALWNTEGVKGMRIRVNNANNPEENEFVIHSPRETDGN